MEKAESLATNLVVGQEQTAGSAAIKASSAMVYVWPGVVAR